MDRLNNSPNSHKYIKKSNKTKNFRYKLRFVNDLFIETTS